MTEFEVTFKSSNSIHYPKPITLYAVLPDTLDADTGLMHFAHGWGGNRYQYREMQRDFAQRYNLACIATEYRMSGYDFDSVTGTGAYRPYDVSHYQVLDCLNAVRTMLGLYPGLKRERLISFGGSQGGHIALLMAVFAPDTFALAISGSGIAWVDAERLAWAGRDMSADELAVRDLVFLSPRVTCPVVLMHGTQDPTVPDAHTRRLEAALRTAGVAVVSEYVEGGGHGLEPVTTRQACTIKLADELLRGSRRQGQADVFAAARRVAIRAASRDLVLDWSRPAADPELLSWQ